jgi:hypothetical protein
LVCSNTLHNIKSDQLFILFWNSKWKKIVFDYSRLFYSIFCLFILFSHSFIKIQTTFAIKSIGRCCFFLIQYCKIIYFWHVFFNFVICLTSNSFSNNFFSFTISKQYKQLITFNIVKRIATYQTIQLEWKQKEKNCRIIKRMITHYEKNIKL